LKKRLLRGRRRRDRRVFDRTPRRRRSRAGTQQKWPNHIQNPRSDEQTSKKGRDFGETVRLQKRLRRMNKRPISNSIPDFLHWRFCYETSGARDLAGLAIWSRPQCESADATDDCPERALRSRLRLWSGIWKRCCSFRGARSLRPVAGDYAKAKVYKQVHLRLAAPAELGALTCGLPKACRFQGQVYSALDARKQGGRYQSNRPAGCDNPLGTSISRW